MPIALNFVVATIYGFGLPIDGMDSTVSTLLFYSLFALFAIILIPGNKYRSVSYSSKDDTKFPKHACNDMDIEQPCTGPNYVDASENDSIIMKLTSPERFGILSLIYGIVLVAGNILFDLGLGNIIGFALFALYGVYISISEKDYSSWGRFKYVHRFILVFGLSYVVRGLIGGGEINRGSSVIEGIFLILLASYMSTKVYQMASESDTPKFMYSLVWLFLVIFLALSAMGMPMAIVELFEEGDLLYSVANAICAIVTFVVLVTVLLYFLLYCRPKQMFFEVMDNQELSRIADHYVQNYPSSEKYTFRDAMCDARAERQKLDTVNACTDAIKKAFEGAGYELDYRTVSDIRKLLESYYPDISRSDIRKIVDTLISSSYGDIDSYNVYQHLDIPRWIK